MISFLGIIASGIIFFSLYGLQIESNSPVFAGSSQNYNNSLKTQGHLTIVLISTDGQFLSDGEFEIKPSPYGSNQSYLIADNSDKDLEKLAPGIITLDNIQSGEYTVKQINTDDRYIINNLTKGLEINDNSVSTVTFMNIPEIKNKKSSEINNIFYNAKFVCGSINGDEGPLRPGHYDTDISILNKQPFSIKILWNAVINDIAKSSSILKTLDSEMSTRIVCEDLYRILDWKPDSGFIDGFVIINIQVNDSILETFSDIDGVKVHRNLENDLDLLSVQVFYTANALEELPKEIVVDRISFIITQDKSGKVPQSLINSTLDVPVHIKPGIIYNKEELVKNTLSRTHNLTQSEIKEVAVEINSSTVSVGSLIDDHAISLFPVQPYYSN